MTTLDQTQREKKPIGFWMATALVIGAMMGAGIFSLPASLASFGTISIVAWVVSAIGSILLAITFIELNKMIPQTGGAFLYTYHAYGDYMGFTMAVSYWFAWCVACAGAVVATISFIAPYWPALNDHSPYFNPYITFFVKLGIVWLTTGINMLGIKAVGEVQLVTALLKLLPLLLIAVFGIFRIHATDITHYYNISGGSNWHALAGAAALTLWAFTGFEAAVVPADDVTDHKVISRATMLGTISIAVLYVILTVVILGMSPATSVKNAVSPFDDVAKSLFGSSAGIWLAICAVVTIVGSVNGGILILAQDAMAAAKYKILPQIFARASSKNHTPVKGIFLAGVLMTLMLLLTVNESLNKQFNFLILLSTLSLLIPYFVCATAALNLLMKHEKKFNRKDFLTAFIVAILASIYAFWTLIGVGQDVIFYGALFFFAIFWLHFIYKWYQWKFMKEE